DGQQVKSQEFKPAVDAFNLGAKHPEEKHVEENVHDAVRIVNESIRQQLIKLPGLERQVRVERQRIGEVGAKNELRDIHREIHDDEINDHRPAAQPVTALVVAIVGAIGDAHCVDLT